MKYDLITCPKCGRKMRKWFVQQEFRYWVCTSQDCEQKVFTPEENKNEETNNNKEQTK